MVSTTQIVFELKSQDCIGHIQKQQIFTNGFVKCCIKSWVHPDLRPANMLSGRLQPDFYRLRLAHTDECPCGTDSQTPEHIIQSCPSHNTLKQETWPYPVDLNEKRWGPTASLRRTADYLVRRRLDV